MGKKYNLIYEGKAKILYEGPEKGTLIQHFKDDATAFNNQKKGIIQGKGVLNNRISEYLMTRLNEIGVPTHFIRSINMREQLVKKVDIIPIEVIIRNIAAGSFATRYGVEEGTVLPKPVIEFCYKKDELGDPFVNDDAIVSLGWADPVEVEEIKLMSHRINDFLRGLFIAVGIRLVDFKLEFGRTFENGYVFINLADEITPDSCRLWDIITGEKLDKDRFRRDLGGVAEAYREVADRLGILTPNKQKKAEYKKVVSKTKKTKKKKAK